MFDFLDMCLTGIIDAYLYSRNHPHLIWWALGFLFIVSVGVAIAVNMNR